MTTVLFSKAKSRNTIQIVDVQKGLLDLAFKRQVLRQRQANAKVLRKFSIRWVVAVMALIIADGILHSFGIEFLSDKLLLALIGGTTANVLGLYAIVIRSLFPSK